MLKCIRNFIKVELTLENENVWLEMLAFSIKSVTVFLPGICSSGPENGKYVMLNWVA